MSNMKVGLFLFAVLVVAASAGPHDGHRNPRPSADLLAKQQCRGCMALKRHTSSLYWCATSMKSDGHGKCYDSAGDTMQVCAGTPIVSEAECPNDKPVSKTTCDSCLGDHFVWCEPNKDRQTFLPVQPKCVAMPERHGKGDAQPPHTGDDTSEKRESDSDSESDSESSDAEEQPAPVPADDQPPQDGTSESSEIDGEGVLSRPPLRRQKAFFYKQGEMPTDEEKIPEDYFHGDENMPEPVREHKNVCPTGYTPRWRVSECAASSDKTEPEPYPHPQPHPVPTPDAGKQKRKRFPGDDIMFKHFSPVGFMAASFLAIIVVALCVARARRRRAMLAMRQASQHMANQPQQFVPIPGFPGHYAAQQPPQPPQQPHHGYPGNYAGMMTPSAPSSQPTEQIPRGLPYNSSSSSAGIPAIPVSEQTARNGSNGAVYAVPVFPGNAMQPAPQRLMPSMERERSMPMQQQPMPVYNVRDIPSGPREQNPTVQIGIPVTASVPSNSYAGAGYPSVSSGYMPSAPAAREMEMSPLPSRQQPQQPQQQSSRMYPQFSGDGYMRLE